jgi:hypothetical protein
LVLKTELKNVCPFCSADRKKKQINVFRFIGIQVLTVIIAEKKGNYIHLNVKNTKQYKTRFKHDKADYSDKFINYVTNVRSIEIKALKALK